MKRKYKKSSSSVSGYNKFNSLHKKTMKENDIDIVLDL